MPRIGGVSRRSFLAQSALVTAGSVAPRAAQKVGQAGSSNEAPPPVTHILADWVYNCSPAQVPDSARREGIRSIVNWLGVTLGGSRQDAVNIAVATLAPLDGLTAARLFGRSEQLDVLRASLINGISSHVLDFDDTDLQTIIHPAGPVASALFALCQQRKITGTELLHCFILGVEVECRLGRAIYPSHYAMGWHITGTCGAFGTAAACGKALRLSLQQIQMALGIAATEAAGLKVEFGSMSKSFNIGRAAENGLLAALLAARGFTSAGNAIEGPDGYVQAASLEHRYNAVTEGLGQNYEISRNTYKPFACGIVIHPAIDAVLRLRRQYHLQPDEILSVTVRANPLALQLTGKKNPRTGLEGKFSIYHSVAVALVRGTAGPAEYTDSAVRDPAVVALRSRVSVRTDPSVHKDEAFVAITTRERKGLDEHVEHAVGSVERPLTDAELSDKYRSLAKDVLPENQRERLLALAWDLQGSQDAAELPQLGSLSSSATSA
jgi:2-methylcitrate dehydratase PrpD